MKTPSLQTRWADFRARNPQTRIRDAARQLGVSEAQLVATGLGQTAVRLDGDFRDLLREVPSLGFVMALTRNDHVVHERKGTYQNVSFTDHMGLVVGEDIDLRLFMMHWKFGFAVDENGRRSLQFFDKSGEAVHKIYLVEGQSHEAAYDALVGKYRAAGQSPDLTTEPYVPKEVEVPDSEIDVAGFRAAWRGMTDTHAFFGMLRKFRVSRTQGLRLAPEGYAYRIAPTGVPAVFEAAAARAIPLMVFVASRGCIQIHTGAVKKLVTTGPWFNVLDPLFNLHLKEAAIAEAWVVKKPTDDGLVTAIELYDAAGEPIALLFGKRKPGQPELEGWRDLVAERAGQPESVPVS
jgi:putative hemin transport protein